MKIRSSALFLPDSDTWKAPYGATEKLWIGIWIGINLLMWACSSALPDGRTWLLSNLAMLAATLLVPQVTWRINQAAFFAGRATMSFVSAAMTYERSGLFIRTFREQSFELAMIEADLLLFGANPSQALQVMHHPWLTEYLQIVYNGYFPLMLAVGIGLFVSRERRPFVEYLFVMNAAMILTHVLYVMVPVQSPFLIADQSPFRELISYETPIQGMLFTDALRQSLLDATANRHDCFPSGHAMHTLITIFFAWKVGRRTGAVVTILGSSIIFSTLYLRYHYAIDLVVGASLAALFIALIQRYRHVLHRQEPQPFSSQRA